MKSRACPIRRNFGVLSFLSIVAPMFGLQQTQAATDTPILKYDVAIHMEMSAGKLGDLGGVDYTAELLPDPGNPKKIFYALGSYHGMLTLRRHKMALDPNECLLEASKSPLMVSGDTNASATLLDGKNLTLYMNPNDWDANFTGLTDFVPTGPVSKMALIFLGAGIMNGTANLDSTDAPGDAPLPEDPPNTFTAMLGLPTGLGRVASLFSFREPTPVRTPAPAPVPVVPGQPIYKVIVGNEDGGPCAGNVSYKQTVRITPKVINKDLHAHFQNTSPTRGGTLMLDGSSSTPFNQITNYHWQITPDASCPAEIQPFEREDQNVNFATLCAMKVKLTVTAPDGATDSTERLVSMKERKWQTEIKIIEKPKPFTNSHLHFPVSFELGTNVCTVEAEKGAFESGHIFHTDTNSPLTWEHSGYETYQVSDSNSPFDGWWYVKRQNMRYVRSVLLNQDLFAGQPVYDINRADCQKRHLSPCPLDLIINATIAHEILHSTLITEAIAADPKLDPAAQLEKLLGKSSLSSDEFREQADSVIKLIQGTLFDVTLDENVVKRMELEHPEWHLKVSFKAPDEDGVFHDKEIPNLNANGE